MMVPAGLFWPVLAWQPVLLAIATLALGLALTVGAGRAVTVTASGGVAMALVITDAEWLIHLVAALGSLAGLIVLLWRGGATRLPTALATVAAGALVAKFVFAFGGGALWTLVGIVLMSGLCASLMPRLGAMIVPFAICGAAFGVPDVSWALGLAVSGAFAGLLAPFPASLIEEPS